MFNIQQIMASVYILHSKKQNSFYIGSCKDLEERIIQHKDKKFKECFTSNQDDWEIYLEFGSLTYKQARSIENHIKKMKSKKHVENLKRYPEMIETLIRRFNII